MQADQILRQSIII